MVFVDYQDRDLRKQVRGIQTTKTRAGVRIIPMIDDVYEAFITEFELQSAIGFCEEEIDGYWDLSLLPPIRSS